MQCIIFPFRKESSQVWRASTSLSLSQFVSRSFLLELVAFTMSDTARSPIHVSFSDEKKEELLVQQPSASSVMGDDSQGQHNAEESPLQVYEIPGSPRQADELNDQPQQSATKKQSVTTYALDMESLPLHLKEFLLAVKQYFNQSISLEREKAAISMSTFGKCHERMVCKWIFLFMSVHFYFL